MTTLSIDNIRQLLHSKICTVVFTKQDGTERTMLCTLNQNVIDMHNLTPVGGGREGPIEQIRCVDVDIMQWRSFNLDSILSFE